MAEAAERPADVAGERPRIRALAALGGKNRVIGVGPVGEFEPIYGYRARRNFYAFALAGQIIGTLPFDLDRRETRRHLLDRAGEARQQRSDRAVFRATFTRIHYAAFGVVGVALFAPAYREDIGLAAVDHERHGLGRFAESNRQAAGGERIERAGMTGALCGEQALDHR